VDVVAVGVVVVPPAVVPSAVVVLSLLYTEGQLLLELLYHH
jgi:hypothetical protein